jgi:uncharacterized cupin superfamily protein
MPKIDLDAIDQINRTGYPPPLSDVVQGRWYRRLGPAAGLSEFGVSHVVLKPRAWSSQRHWHEGEDEFMVMIAGEAVLIDDQGRTPLIPGDCAAFPRGDGNGHHVINESDADCVFVVVGRPSASACHYPDVDLYLDAGKQAFCRKDGTPY